MIRRFKLTLFALFCFVVAGQFGWTSAQEMTAEKAFKNIQALKGIPASQITPFMDNFNKALGVSCDYCHVPNALEKGDKAAHKMSIQMIKMTRDINQRYSINIDCMACHQGKPKPPHLGQSMKFGPAGAGGGGGTDLKQRIPDKVATTTPPKTTTTPPAVTTGGAKAEAEPPGKVVFKASFGAVAFDHGQHMNVGDCAKCHHTGENNKCDTCHLHNKKAGPATQVTFYAASHGTKSERSCTGCHIQSKAGPTKCAECHKK